MKYWYFFSFWREETETETETETAFYINLHKKVIVSEWYICCK